MGWTIKPGRRRDRLRHRPHLENLDDRCLLSAGLERPLGHIASTLRGPREVRFGGDIQAKGDRLVAGHHGHAAAGRERPAGAESVSITSAGAAYDSVIGASTVQSNYGVNGTGMTVAVIDTGIDSNSAALGGGFGPGSKVVAGFDFSDPSVINPPDQSNAGSLSSQHGTGVAGLIGSDSPSDPGVAPGVDLVDLKVTDGSNTASLQSIANALQWVVNNHAQYNITVVNLSMGDGGNYAQNWFATTGGAAEQVTNLIGQLRAMDIPVVVATGNNFNGAQGEDFAAIVQGTISVTATDLSGHLLPDAQRLGSSIGGASATVIAAPGDGMSVPYGDNQTATVDGTSFSTALVSGSVVLLQQIYRQRFGALPSVDQIQQWLQGGSDPINDPVTGITIGQLDLPKAAALVPKAPVATLTPKPSTTSVQVSTASVVPMSAPTVTSSITTATTTTVAAATPATPATSPSAPATSPSTPAQPAPAATAVLAGPTTTVTGGSAVPQPLSGLARLLQNMKVWEASSVAQD